MKNSTPKIILFSILFIASYFAMYAQGPPGSGWGNPVFQDNFNGTSLDTSKWRVKNATGSGEGEGQFRANKVSVSGGKLIIKNDLVSNGKGGRRGGWVDSKVKFGNGAARPKYGYFEAELRINLQGINFNWQGGKIWPTWWLWEGHPSDPTEFDLMEYSRWTNFKADNNATTSHHYRNGATINGNRKYAITDKNSPRDEFNWHRWGMLWTPTEVTFYYDGVPYGSSDQPGDAALETIPLKLIFSTSPHVDTFRDLDPLFAPRVSDVLPSLEVRWVRVWQGGNPSGGNPPGGGNDPVVAFKKGNVNFGIDGNNGGANGQNVYLWSYNQNNVNQQWVEIDRGNGYYSYQKRNTNFCLDGGNGGADAQNVYLWTCGNNNQNQHWKKINIGNGNVRLEKRNAPAFSIDGNNGGANGQNLYLWSSNSSNPNQQWTLTNLSTSNRSSLSAEKLDLSKNGLSIYPNPNATKDITTFDINLKEEGNVSLKVYDMVGREVASVLNEVLPVGNHKMTWSPKNNATESMYLVILKTPTYSKVSKLLFTK